MKFSTTLILFFAMIIATASHRNFDSSSDENNNQFLQELQMEMELERAFDKPMPRHRRVPAPGDLRACGRKLIMFVLTVCQDSCNPQQGKDIATLCCSHQCSEDTIKQTCCPSQ